MKKVLFALMLAGLFSQNTIAQTQGGTTGLEPGDKAVTIYGAIISTEYDDTMLLTGAYDQAIDNKITIGGTATITTSDAIDTLTLAVRGRYHIATPQPIVPYVGAGGAYTDFDIDSYFNLAGEVGFLQPISENVDLDYNFAILVPLDSDYDTTTIASVGIKITF